MSSNNFNKQMLARYMQSECKRQLFLDLAQVMPEKWYTDKRKIEIPKKIRRMHNKLLELGHTYEQNVYNKLRFIKGAQYNVDQKGKVDDTYINPEMFSELYDELKNSPLNDFILLEYQFEVPDSFLHYIFDAKGGVQEIPVNYGDQRPDIMLIGSTGNNLKNEVNELLPDGSIRRVPENELKTRFGVNIIDVKNIREDHIGKKQFIEIFYYLWTFSFYLKEHNLVDKFFVRIDFNGIFPQYNEYDLASLSTLEELVKLTIKINYDESFQIFIDTINQIKKLWNKAPIPIESIPVNIQPSCGYCYFIEDCKKSLGKDGETDPKDWSVKLLPYTSSSIAQQLINEHKLETIGDVADKINMIKVGNTPNPIYPELPLLENKALSIINDQIVLPSAGHTHSYAIPRYSPISVTFAVETDPANDRVYAAGFFLRMYAFANSYFNNIFDKWWKVWKDTFKENKTPKDIQEELNNFLFIKIKLVEVEDLFNIFNKLEINEHLIHLRGEKTKAGKPRKQTQVIFQYAAINEGHDNDTEAEFTKDIIIHLFYILELTNYMEKFVIFVTNESEHGYIQYYGPSTSLFYWGKRQLNNFQEMLERNLVYIIDDREIEGKYLDMLSLFTPSDSEVTHPFQHKKIFDLKEFTETIIGFPAIINYTWHGIAEKVLNTFSKRDYWILHFNYMDFNNWYEMVSIDDPKDADEIFELRKEIIRQIMHKVRTINNIRLKYQIESRYVISKNARARSHAEIRRVSIPKEYHAIAHVWYLFSKLTGSQDEREVEYFRTTYPEYSIGKLAAAKVSNLARNFVGDKYYFTFEITGLSSNMKINTGDRVLLLPNEKRDMRTNKRMERWKIIVSEMTWSKRINGYSVKTDEKTTKSYEKLGLPDDIKPLKWYLYTTSMDVWSNKLYKGNGLLQRHHFGNSWLGARLAYKWKIRSKPILKWPKDWSFTAPSVYLFAPELLQTSLDTKLDDDLETPIDPIPDPSQKKAINLALNKIISGIQGPPGTGKSQTIAALIDEFCIRSFKNGKRSVKILVSAFSYAAIRVLIDKIKNSKNQDGSPTKASQLQMVFLRSEYQENIDGIDNLVRHSKNTWKMNDESHSVTNTKPLDAPDGKLEKSYIMFGNAHQLFHLIERVDEDTFTFDLLCVDEASQLPVDNFMSMLQFINQFEFKISNPKPTVKSGEWIKEIEEIDDLSLNSELDMSKLTKVVIVGDYNQLPPVQPVPPPKNLEKILESLFAYYVKHHIIPNTQLQVNYRSNKQIVGFTSLLGVYQDLIPHSSTAERTLEGDLNKVKEQWVKEVLNPEKVVSTIIHKKKFEIGVSLMEAEIVKYIILGYFKMRDIKSANQERNFWKTDVGVVSPHNAQGRLIIRHIFDELTNGISPQTKLKNDELMKLLKATIYSVEKFQGSDRELIISSIGISDKDQLSAESEFIYNQNRFNVLTSRAKCKVILVASEKFLNFIPQERTVMQEAAQIHKYAYKYCNKSENLSIEVMLNEKKIQENVEFRYKE